MIPQRVPILQGGPDAYLDFDFRFGQEAYWLNRQRYGDFSLVPGATSTGGAGFGTVQRNGVWQSVAANAPLIGDGGLLVPEAKTEIVGLSCRPADANWIASGGTKAVSSVHKGIFRGAKAVSGGVNWNRLNVPLGAAVTSGQLYTVVARYKAGSSNRVLIELRNAAGATVSQAAGDVADPSVAVQGSGTLALVENVDEGEGVRRTVLAWTPNFTGSIDNTGIGPNSSVVGEDIEVLGLSIQAGAYVGNPPIDNENLPATRTAVDQSVLITPPPAFEVRGRFKLSALPAADSFCRVFSLNDGSTNNYADLFINSAGWARQIVRTGGVTVAEFGTRAILPGEEAAFVARFKANGFSLIVNNQAVETDTSGAMPVGLDRIRLGNNSEGYAERTLKGEIANLSIREVD